MQQIFGGPGRVVFYSTMKYMKLMLFFLKWAFTMLATEVLKYNFLNFYIAKTMLCILLKFVQVTLNK